MKVVSIGSNVVKVCVLVYMLYVLFVLLLLLLVVGVIVVGNVVFESIY